MVLEAQTGLLLIVDKQVTVLYFKEHMKRSIIQSRIWKEQPVDEQVASIYH